MTPPATYRDSGTDFNRDEATVTRRVVALADRLATAAAEPPAQGRVPRRGAARVPLLGSRGLAPRRERGCRGPLMISESLYGELTPGPPRLA